MNQHAVVEVNGFQWDSWKHPRLFSRLRVELTTGESSEAVWEVFDPDFRFLNKYSEPAGVPLAPIRIWVGFGPQLGEPVFKGLLARVQRGEAITTLVSYDMGFKMRLAQRTEYHKGEDLAIIRKLVQRHKLSFEGPEKPLKLEPHPAMPQDEQTDWEHASERARESGLVLWVREDTVFAKYPAKVGTPKLMLTNRKDFKLLRDFDLTFRVPENQEGRPRKVTVRGRSRGGKRLTGESDTSARGNEPLSIKRDLPQHTKKHATARAQAQKELDREHAFTLYIRSQPAQQQRVDVRDTLRLLEVGKLFSGDYLVDKVIYDFSPGRFFTSYELYRDVKQ